jgi:hypothetical protein
MEAVQNTKSHSQYIPGTTFSIGILYIIIGMPLFGLTFQLLQEFIKKTWKKLKKNVKIQHRKFSVRIRNSIYPVEYDDDTETGSCIEEKDECVDVPS